MTRARSYLYLHDFMNYFMNHFTRGRGDGYAA